MIPATAPIRLAACECLTALGATRETHAALLRGETALRAIPVLGREGGDPVPIALLPERANTHSVCAVAPKMPRW